MIAVLDYGIGNLRSAQKAIERLGVDARLVSEPEDAKTASGIVLPGVGNFGTCMRALRDSRLDRVVYQALDDGTPFLGICVGMQMLFSSSEESPGVDGLGIFEGEIRLLPADVKRPQMQWNQLHFVRPSWVVGQGSPGSSPISQNWMYFVHSFAGPVQHPDLVATCEYGGPVAALYEKGNLAAVQFHPEKSGAAGLEFLRAFVTKTKEGS